MKGTRVLFTFFLNTRTEPNNVFKIEKGLLTQRAVSYISVLGLDRLGAIPHTVAEDGR